MSPALPIGTLIEENNLTEKQVYFDLEQINKNLLITGADSTGKSNTLKNLLAKLRSPFILFSTNSNEYRQFKVTGKSIKIYTVGDKEIAPIWINPFEIYDNDSDPAGHSMLTSILQNSFELSDLTITALEDCLCNSKSSNINQFIYDINQIKTSISNKFDSVVFSELSKIIYNIQYYLPETFSDKSAFNITDLTTKSSILELSRLPNNYSKRFFTNTLLTLIISKLKISTANSFRKTEPLVFIFEDAHELFPKGRTSSIISYFIQQADRVGYSFIFLDTRPELLDDSIICATNSKFIHCLNSREGAIVAGASIGFNSIDSLSINLLKTGEAYFKSPNFSSPLKIAVNKLGLTNIVSYKVTDESLKRSAGNVPQPPQWLKLAFAPKTFSIHYQEAKKYAIKLLQSDKDLSIIIELDCLAAISFICKAVITSKINFKTKDDYVGFTFGVFVECLDSVRPQYISDAKVQSDWQKQIDRLSGI